MGMDIIVFIKATLDNLNFCLPLLLANHSTSI